MTEIRPVVPREQTAGHDEAKCHFSQLFLTRLQTIQMSSTLMTWEIFDHFYLKIQTEGKNVWDMVATRRCWKVIRNRTLFLGDLGK